VVLQAQDVAFGFADAAMREVGDTASVTNFFEQGPGLLQPAGVSGEQPPPGLLLEDSRLFSYVALFGQLDPSLCGRQWQVRPARQADAAMAMAFNYISHRVGAATVVAGMLQLWGLPAVH
jgi:hypothetical protein